MGAKEEIRPKWPAIYTFSGGEWCQEAAIHGFAVCVMLRPSSGKRLGQVESVCNWTDSNLASTHCTTHNIQPAMYPVYCPKYDVLLSTFHIPTPLPSYTVPHTMGYSHCPQHNVYHTMCCAFPSALQAKTDTQCEHTMWLHIVILDLCSLS